MKNLENIDVEAIYSALDGTGNYGRQLVLELKSSMLPSAYDYMPKFFIEKIAKFAARFGYLELFKLTKESLDSPLPSYFLDPVIFQYLLPIYKEEICFNRSKHLVNSKNLLLNSALDAKVLLKNFSQSIRDKDIEVIRFFHLEKNLKMDKNLGELIYSSDYIMNNIFTSIDGRYDAIKYLFQNSDADFLNKNLKQYLAILAYKCGNRQYSTSFTQDQPDYTPDSPVIATLFLDHYRFSSPDVADEKFEKILSEEQKMPWLKKTICSAISYYNVALGNNDLSIHLALLTQNKFFSELNSKEVLEQISRSPFLDQNARRYALSIGKWTANTQNIELDLQQINLDYHHYIAATAIFSAQQRLVFSHQISKLPEYDSKEIASYVAIYQKAMPYFKIHVCTQIFIEYLTQHVLFRHGLIQLWSALSETPREKPEKCFCLASRYSWLKLKPHAEEKFSGHDLVLKESLTEDQEKGVRNGLTLEQVHDSRYRSQVLQAVNAGIPFVKAITLSDDQILEKTHMQSHSYSP